MQGGKEGVKVQTREGSVPMPPRAPWSRDGNGKDGTRKANMEMTMWTGTPLQIRMYRAPTLALQACEARVFPTSRMNVSKSAGQPRAMRDKVRVSE
jgi:hypothetical protein